MTTYDTSHLATEELAEFSGLLEREHELLTGWSEDMASGDSKRVVIAAEKATRYAEAQGLTAESDLSEIDQMRRADTPRQKTDRMFSLLRILAEK